MKSSSGRLLGRLALRLPIYALALLLAWIVPALLLYRPITAGGEPVPVASDLVLVGHAGAGLTEAAYSNSLEALEAAAARGLKLVEVDLIATRDGEIVLSHDWDRAYTELHPGISPIPSVFAHLAPPPAPTHAQFMARSLRGGLTPVDLDGLAAWLSATPGVRLVTDVKGDNLATLAELAGRGDIPLDRIVPQIYHRDELGWVRNLGFRQVIHTLYRDPSANIGEVITFASANGMTVTIPLDRANEETVRRFVVGGVPLYVNTVNDPSEAQMLKEWGVSGVYTDFLMPVALASPASDL